MMETVENIAAGEPTAPSLWKKFLAILTSRQRRDCVVLALMMTIGMLLEMAGVGIVVPALAVMTNPDAAAAGDARFQSVLDWLGRPSQSQLVLIGMGALFALHVVKAVYLAYLYLRQTRFIHDVQAGLSKRLFRLYLLQPWPFHLSRNSAHLMRNISVEVNAFGQVTYGVLTIATEAFVLIGIAILLLMLAPVSAVLIGLFLGIATWVFHQSTRGALLRWGRARQHHDALKYQHMQQGLGGAKDVKMLNCEREFIDRYSRHADAVARQLGNQGFLTCLPRLWYELIAVGALSGLTIALMATGVSPDRLVPILGLFAAAAFRVMPSANRLLLAMQSIKFSTPSIDTLYDEVRLEMEVTDDDTAITPLPLHRSIRVRDVSFAYGGQQKPALQGVSLEIPVGTTVGFIGESGAGKSTLVDLLLGLLAPTSGTITVDEVDIRTNLRGWRANVGYVPQSIYLSDDTLRNNIAFGLKNEEIDEGCVARAVRDAQLESLVAHLPQGLDTLIGERGVRLSGGQRQRIGIARALYKDPAVLILDEATSALDTETEREVMAAINSLHGSKTVVIVAHRLSTVSQCDVLYRLAGGVIVKSGRVAEVVPS